MNEAANDSARVGGQDRKIAPALGTNQIAVFAGFRPLASLEKNKIPYLTFVFCLLKGFQWVFPAKNQPKIRHFLYGKRA